MNLKRLLAAGGALVIVGGAVVGVSVVSAQTAPAPTPQSRQDLRNRYDQALANRLHVTVDQLKQAIADARKDVGLPDPATRPTPAPGQQPGARRGPGGFGSPGGPGFAGRGFGGFLGQEADAVAALFKEDRAALIAELPGKTIEEVATAHGVTTQQVTDTITKTANDQIDKFAQARNVPADRVNQLKQRMSERVQEFVTTHRFPARGTGTRS
jgi:hypothetical protein